jgi:hypothetical protein
MCHTVTRKLSVIFCAFFIAYRTAQSLLPGCLDRSVCCYPYARILDQGDLCSMSGLSNRFALNCEGSCHSRLEFSRSIGILRSMSEPRPMSSTHSTRKIGTRIICAVSQLLHVPSFLTQRCTQPIPVKKCRVNCGIKSALEYRGLPNFTASKFR